MIYKNQQRSYRDLPLRWAELGTVYRYEKSGVMHGLLRVRGFTQDDAHIICTPEQIDDEILEVLRFSLKIWRAFGFDGHQGIPGHEAAGRDRRRRDMGQGHRRPEARRGDEKLDYRDGRGRRRLLRAQDRPQDQGRPGPRVADDHHPVRLERARAVRAHLRGLGQHAEAALHGAPRAPGVPGEVLRRPGRALRRRVPAWLAPVQVVAIPVTPGVRRVRRGGGEGARRPAACGRSWTRGTSG